MTSSFRVAVLVSGEGTNLQALIDQVHGRDGIEIVGVAASRTDARGLERARAAGIGTATFPIGDYEHREDRDAALGDWLDDLGVELVVLAGFMELLGGGFIRRFDGRIVNVHPSLLPAFPGVRAIEQAVAHGVKVMGVTVHYVDEGVDTGPIVLQEAFEVTYPQTVRDVEHRVHEVEHRLLSRAVRLIASGTVSADPGNPRVMRIEHGRGD